MTEKLVLVTGACGEIGQALVQGLAKQGGYRIVTSDLAPLPDSIKSMSAEHAQGDLVAQQAKANSLRRSRVAGDAFCHRRPRRLVHHIDEAERKLGELPVFLGRVHRLLHVEFGHHAQQRRLNVDALASRQFDEAVQIGSVRHLCVCSIHRGCRILFLQP